MEINRKDDPKAYNEPVVVKIAGKDTKLSFADAVTLLVELDNELKSITSKKRFIARSSSWDAKKSNSQKLAAKCWIFIGSALTALSILDILQITEPHASMPMLVIKALLGVAVVILAVTTI